MYLLTLTAPVVSIGSQGTDTPMALATNQPPYLQKQRYKLCFIPSHPYPSHSPPLWKPTIPPQFAGTALQTGRKSFGDPRDGKERCPNHPTKSLQVLPGNQSWLNLMWGNKSEQELIVVSSHPQEAFVSLLLSMFASRMGRVVGTAVGGRQCGHYKWPAFY